MVSLREKRGLSGKDTLLYGIGIYIFVMATLIYVWPSVKIVSVNREYGRLEKERNELAKHNRLLRIELQSLHSYEVIENEASKRGFRLPLQGEVIYVETESEGK